MSNQTQFEITQKIHQELAKLAKTTGIKVNLNYSLELCSWDIFHILKSYSSEKDLQKYYDKWFYRWLGDNGQYEDKRNQWICKRNKVLTELLEILQTIK